MVTYNYMFSGIYGPYYAYPVMMLFKNRALVPYISSILPTHLPPLLLGTYTSYPSTVF